MPVLPIASMSFTGILFVPLGNYQKNADYCRICFKAVSEGNYATLASISSQKGL